MIRVPFLRIDRDAGTRAPELMPRSDRSSILTSLIAIDKGATAVPRRINRAIRGECVRSKYMCASSELRRENQRAMECRVCAHALHAYGRASSRNYRRRLYLTTIIPLMMFT